MRYHERLRVVTRTQFRFHFQSDNYSELISDDLDLNCCLELRFYEPRFCPFLIQYPNPRDKVTNYQVIDLSKEKTSRTVLVISRVSTA